MRALSTPTGIFSALVTLALVAFCVWQFGIKPAREREARRRAIAISDVDAMSGEAFEHFVAELLRFQGFTATVTQASGDLGVDIVAQRGGDRWAIQCKRYSSPVPRTAVSDAVAGRHHYRCQHAVVVTNSQFSPGAQQLASSSGCALVDREQLSVWIYHFQQKQPFLGLQAPQAEPATRQSRRVA